MPIEKVEDHIVHAPYKGEEGDPNTEPVLFSLPIRDHFAGLAMQGYIMQSIESGEDPLISYAEYIAKWAYEQADAMMKARMKGRAE